MVRPSFKNLFASTRFKRGVTAVCIGVPATSAAIFLGLDTGYAPSSSLHWTHISRDMFTCSPRLDSLWLEVLCVHVHFVVCSLVIAWSLFGISRHIATVVVKNKNRAGGSNNASTWIVTRIWNTCPKIFALSVSALVLLAIHTTLAIELIPYWDDFGKTSEMYITCKRLEVLS